MTQQFYSQARELTQPCTWMLTDALFIRGKSLSVDKRINETWSIHKTEYYSAIEVGHQSVQ